MIPTSTRRRIVRSIAAAVGVGGTAGCLESLQSGGAGEPVSEPDTLPAGLDEDGIEVEALRQHVVQVISEGSYHAIGVRDRYTASGSLNYSRGRSGRGNAAQERALHLEGSNSERELELDLRDEELRRIDYYESDRGYRNWGSSDPETWDRDYDYFTRFVLDSWVERVMDALSAAEWEQPEWDRDQGVFVVAATAYHGSDSVHFDRGELHVTADGLPIRLVAEYEIGDETREDEVAFDAGDIEIERPDWAESLQDS